MGLDYTIQYKKRIKNEIVDVLSRRDHESETGDENLKSAKLGAAATQVTSAWVKEIESSYQGDELANQLEKELMIAPDSNSLYTLKQGILRYRKIFLGEKSNLLQKILQECHSLAVGGHSGMRGTYEQLEHHFYWPKVKQQKTEMMRCCEISRNANQRG